MRRRRVSPQGGGCLIRQIGPRKPSNTSMLRIRIHSRPEKRAEKFNMSFMSEIISRLTTRGALLGITLSLIMPIASQESSHAYYTFTNHTFTNCGQTGRTGPSQASCRSQYSTTWDETDAYYIVSSGIQLWTVPWTGNYRIEAWGAAGSGGNGGGAGGSGAKVQGDFTLTQGTKIRILVGQMGATSNPNVSDGASGSGGGGTFVISGASGTDDSQVLLIAAGGGGSNDPRFQGFTSNGIGGLGSSSGTGTADNSGGSYRGTSTGASLNGASFSNGGQGGTYSRSGSIGLGGFGGGGATDDAKTGGGGWIGGTSDVAAYSKNNGSNQVNQNSIWSDHGKATITSLGPAVDSFSPPSTLTNSASFIYTLSFTQSVTGLATADFSVSGTGSSTCSIGSPSGSGATYQIQLTGCSPGTVILTLAQNSVTNSSSQTGPSSSSNASTVTIDQTAPTISSVSAPSDGTYSPTGQPTGSALNFTVAMNESVTVTGSPRLTLTVGSVTRYATYVSQSDSRTLTFRYTPATSSSEIDSDGISMTSSLDLNGGSISDLATNALSNTSLTPPTLTGVLIAQRASASTITSITPGNNQLSVAFTAGASNGASITNYKYSLNGGSFTAFSPADTTTPVVITGLTNGTSYAVRILTVTSVGDGESSTAVTATPTAIVVANGSNISAAYGDTGTSSAFTASGGTSPYVFSLSPAITGVSINSSSGVVTTSPGLAVGTYSTFVVATDAASRTGQAAISITISKSTPAFSSWSSVTKTFGDSSYSITAPSLTQSIAGSFTYTSSNSAVISISGSTATVAGAGAATITALFTPSDLSNYETSTTTHTVTVNKATQTITFATLSDKTLGMSSFSLSATSTSGLTVTFGSSTPTICTVSSTTVSLAAAGLCTISASQEGNTNYESATVVTRSFTVSSTLVITTPTSGLSGSFNAAFSLTLSVSGGSGGNQFSLASGTLPVGLLLSTSAGTISGTATTAGSSAITITVTDSNGATSTTSSFTITISQLTPTISLAVTDGVSSTPIGVSITIIATVSQAGSVAFRLGGSAISGCSAVPSSSGMAACSWIPASLGNASLTAVLTPTDSTNYLAATSSPLAITVVTGTSAISLSISGTPTKGATITITATTTDIAGRVAFFLNGTRIIGCTNKAVSSATADCLWKVSRHGEQTLSARFTPTNSAYRASSTQVKVLGLRRTSRT